MLHRAHDILTSTPFALSLSKAIQCWQSAAAWGTTWRAETAV